MKTRLLLTFLTLLITSYSNAKPLPLMTFAKHAEYEAVKLSPDGKHYAAKVPKGNETVLIIIKRDTNKPVGIFRFGPNQHVNEFYWVNNERMVYTRNIKESWQEQSTSYRQIYSGNIDGSKNLIAFGYKGGRQEGNPTARHQGPEDSWGRIVNLLPDDPKHILIEARSMYNDMDAAIRIIRLNVYSTKKRLITRTPFGNMKVLYNSKGTPISADGTDAKGNEKTFFYSDSEWIEISDNKNIQEMTPHAVNKSGTKLYLAYQQDNKTDVLYEYTFATKKLTPIFHHKTSDIWGYIRNPEDGVIVGITVMPGSIEYHYLDKNNEFSKTHINLTKVFKGSHISISSITKDKKEMVVQVMDDKNAGDYYIYNKEKQSLSYMLSRKSWIDPDLMAAKKPIQFNARDGKVIHGYLTLPVNAKEQIPLVTYVHGGPFGVRDDWLFDETAQMLANNGFAVLQVNYRGSGGYGKEYESIAYRKLSTLIQHDIIDGTKWALSQKEILDDKACIMGWSFGGYSALMAPLVDPELFKCSIAAAGVYDAVEQENDADYSEIASVSTQAAEVYGDDEKLLKEESPLTYIDKLKIPVFIVHGGRDERVPPEQAHLLKAALDKRNMPYEWMFKEKEGHGFFNEDNEVEFYQRTLDFLNKHLH